jgi:hypothetical protein
VNRASRLSYGEATGITQTVRNYTASLGLAILGTILVTEMRSRLTGSLVAQGVPRARAQVLATQLSQSTSGGGSGSGSGSGSSSASSSLASIPHFYRLDFAYATRTVLFVMAGIMAAAAIVAILGLRRGVQEDPGGAADPEARVAEVAGAGAGGVEATPDSGRADPVA